MYEVHKADNDLVCHVVTNACTDISTYAVQGSDLSSYPMRFRLLKISKITERLIHSGLLAEAQC